MSGSLRNIVLSKWKAKSGKLVANNATPWEANKLFWTWALTIRSHRRFQTVLPFLQHLVSLLLNDLIVNGILETTKAQTQRINFTKKRNTWSNFQFITHENLRQNLWKMCSPSLVRKILMFYRINVKTSFIKFILFKKNQHARWKLTSEHVSW